MHIGCFSNAVEASVAWDNESRRRGMLLLNSPCPDSAECGVRLVLQQRVDRFEASPRDAGFPYVTVDAAWRSRQLQSLLECARTGQLDAVWDSSGRGVQQADHWCTPGNLLCFSYNPHVFATRKARSCIPGWMDEAPRLSDNRGQSPVKRT